MGDALGDIVYILLMLGALIFSLYKKSKSAGQDGDFMPEHEVGESPGEAFPTFKDLFGDADEEEKVPAIGKKTPETEYATMQAEKLKPQKLEYKKPVYQSIQKRERIKKPERVSRIKQKISQMSLATKEKAIDETSYWDDEEFDLKKAIIYSEIIKRPTI
ncbi:hypothetical protein [Alkalitalea saponilacus]|uniref:Uncharacterized protein n=1 Tax=Alkalitalea saponilacus TaxID=889453 RepID=A0A1T5A7V1_9BACT|nr:hypothetical protein [Alkalitalea saponilacus]ASB48813.1 hypothetical protein CDL62_06550 [Alkalitalea saponilacus]SKB30996.1 hypothetical protein SAMN03080601_00127 [Alkalitalea saponilacus]